MKQLFMATVMAFSFLMLSAQTDLSYYLPSDIQYNPDIPTPEPVIGHPVCEWHLTHDKLVFYLQELASLSGRVTYEEYARSHENRPLFHLVITSPENHARLEEIRKEHVALSDPAQSASMDITGMPIVVRLGYGVHGNESSASNASVVVAYYLAAAEGEKINSWLENTVILLDPCLNPDGFNRHASWINTHKSKVPMSDPNNRGFREPWPGGRTNHYWFDLNRDWNLVQHPESKGRVKVFHEWKPNVQTDHHEMGSGSTFFFQPGILSRTHPYTPERTTELTRKIAEYHERALDNIGSLYYTEERFDDYYYGKGSSYPDVNGCIGILFEQAGTRGFERETDRGELTFPFAIRNQVKVSLSSLEASLALKDELLTHQKDFYTSALSEAAGNPVNAYLFGENDDRSRINQMLKILLSHKISVHSVNKPVTIGGTRYEPGSSYLVPLSQPQYRLVQSFFEPSLSFADSLFYDISAWTLPHAFDIPYEALSSARQVEELTGDEITGIPEQDGRLIGETSKVGYLFEWKDYFAPATLYKIQSAGLMANAATEPFKTTINGSSHEFGCGTIFIPAQKQVLGSDELYSYMKQLAEKSGFTIYSAGSSYTRAGADLGSDRLSPIDKPEILLLTGSGASSTVAGEIWHLLDTRMHMPVTLIDQEQLDRMDLSGYNTVILPSGSFNEITEQGISRIKDWVSGGGNIIAINRANSWLVNKKLISLKFKSAEQDTGSLRNYKDLYLNRGAQYIPGTIFEAEVDISHPVAYGLSRNTIPLFKNSTLFAEPAGKPYAVPVRYKDDPLLSGYISERNYELLKNTPAVVISSIGSGKIISFIDDPNFRAFWYGTNRLFMNAVFFGPLISPYSTR